MVLFPYFIFGVLYADTPSTTTTLLLQRTRDLQRQTEDELTQVRLQHTQF